ncbi:unnamed protein product [Moneuplotes crassus]|uniref:Uncharacterized protein n=1 Tax=Euplotes crassus TaxID=5936 RepID=A0AAD1XBC0_EUPCR|nr:unnamed protein product [Moneuplotes crassus]
MKSLSITKTKLTSLKNRRGCFSPQNRLPAKKLANITMNRRKKCQQKRPHCFSPQNATRRAFEVRDHIRKQVLTPSKTHRMIVKSKDAKPRVRRHRNVVVNLKASRKLYKKPQKYNSPRVQENYFSSGNMETLPQCNTKDSSSKKIMTEGGDDKPLMKNFQPHPLKFYIDFEKIHENLKEKLGCKLSEVADQHRCFSSPTKLFEKIRLLSPASRNNRDLNSFGEVSSSDIDLSCAQRQRVNLKSSFKASGKRKQTEILI